MRAAVGPDGRNVVVRCRQGHLFTTIWIPGGSLKALRLRLVAASALPGGQALDDRDPGEGVRAFRRRAAHGRASTATSASPDGSAMGVDELQLAARNHGLPLEALAYPVTPLGLHYVLTHFDVPGRSTPRAGGSRSAAPVHRPASLGLADIRARPAVTTAGDDGVRRQRPRPRAAARHQPAVAARGRGHDGVDGRPVAAVLDEAGVRADAPRSCSRASTPASTAASSRCTPAACRSPMPDATASCSPTRQTAPAPAPARLPAAAGRPGWYGMTSVKWLGSDPGRDRALPGLPAGHGLPDPHAEDEPGDPGHPHGAARADDPARDPGLHDARAVRRRRPRCRSRAGPGRGGRRSTRWSSRATAASRGIRPSSPRPSAGHAWRGWSLHVAPDRPGRYELCCAARDDAGNRQPLDAAVERGGYCNNAVQRVAVTCGEAGLRLVGSPR